MSASLVEVGFVLKAQDDGSFSGTIRAGQDAVKQLGAAGQQAGDQVLSGSNRGREGVSQLAAESDKLSSAIQRVGHYGALAFGFAELKSGVGELVNAATSMDRFNNVIAIATGSAKNAAIEYDYIRGLSQKLGLEVTGTAAAFASFSAASRGTSLEGEKTRAVFASVSGVTAKMGLDAEASKGVFNALSQMMSKGVVSAEEFRQQLGERLPIATEAGARAMKVTTAEFTNLLNSGKLLSEDFLPKFAAALNEVGGGAAVSLQADLNRLSNNWTAIKQNMADAAPLHSVASVLVSLTGNTQVLTAGVSALTVGIASLSAGKLVDYLSNATVAMTTKTAATTAAKEAALAAAEADMAQATAGLSVARTHSMITGSSAGVTAALNAQTAAQVRLDAAQAASSASAGVLRGAMALIPSPLTAITLVLAAGAAAWSLWGNSAEEAGKKANAELNAMRQQAADTGADMRKLLVQKRESVLAELRDLSSRNAGSDEVKEKVVMARMLAEQIHNLDLREQNLKAATVKESDAWGKFYATKAEQHKKQLEELDALYKNEQERFKGHQDKLTQLASEYQVKRTEIEAKFSKKSIADKAKNESQIEATLKSLQDGAVKKALEDSGYSANAAAAQIKVYELAAKRASKEQIDLAQSAVDQIRASDEQAKATKAATAAWDDAGKLLAKHSELAKQAVEQQVFLTSLEGKSAVEVAKLNAERTVQLQIERELAAFREKYKDNPAAADAGVSAIKAQMPGIISATGSAAGQSELDKFGRQQGNLADPSKAEMANYQQQLEMLKQANEQKLLTDAAYKLRVEAAEKAHQVSMVAIGRAGQMSLTQFELLNSKTKFAIVVGGLQDILGAAAQHNRAAFEMNKVAKLAEAVPIAYSSVMKAYDFGSSWGGPVGGAAMAAVAAAAQFANLNAIASASFGGGGGGASAGGGGGTGTGAMPGQTTNNSVPYSAGQNVTQQSAAPQVHITVQALDPSSVSPIHLQSIADTLAPMLNQTMSRNGQNIQVMV
jgi:tape measure domain-containing protein